VSSPQDTFEPQNDLEKQLLSAQSGQLAIPDFVSALVDSQVFVLLDGEVSDSGDMTGVQPLQLADQQGNTFSQSLLPPNDPRQWQLVFPTSTTDCLSHFVGYSR
jgi:hypothetical protein